MSTYTARIAICVLFAILPLPPGSADAQQPSAEATLAAGISQVRAGQTIQALFTLDEAVKQLSARRDASGALARAHAYRAAAYAALDQPERARAAALLALNADPGLTIAGPEFDPETVALFAAARRPVDANTEAVAQTAERSGRFAEAFLGYLSAYQSLSEPLSPVDDQRLRTQIITVVGKLPAEPEIPPEAREHYAKAQTLVDAEAVLGNTSNAAAIELRQAIRIAPWWSDATLQLAKVLQKLERVDEALLNLQLYRLADASATNTAAASSSPAAVPAASGIAPAKIYVYWPNQVRGGGRPKVLCDGIRVADLSNNHFVVLDAPAGTHTLKMPGGTYAAAVQPGASYYVRVSAEGFPVHAVLSAATAEEAEAEMRQKQMTPNDPKKTYSTACNGVMPTDKQKPRIGNLFR